MPGVRSRPPPYDYIRRMYRVSPRIGGRVMHSVTKEIGYIGRPNRTHGHYVNVAFDVLQVRKLRGGRRPSRRMALCHPTELVYLDDQKPGAQVSGALPCASSPSSPPPSSPPSASVLLPSSD